MASTNRHPVAAGGGLTGRQCPRATGWAGRAVRPRRAGFTLTEILCVVVILGIAGIIVVPQIGARDDLRASAAARVMMADLVYAQNRAITLQKFQYVEFDASAQTYTLKTAPAPLTTLTHPVEKVSYVMKFNQSGSMGLADTSLYAVDLQPANASAKPTLAFDELGTPLVYDSAAGTTTALTSGSITVRSGDHKLRVGIEAYTGLITVTAVP